MDTDTQSLSSEISKVVVGIVEAADPAGIAGAKERLLHGLGVAFGSADLPASNVAWTTMRTRTGNCRVIGREPLLAADAAAFVNAVAAHNSLQEDCGPGGLAEGSHPGTYVVPAALAAAQEAGASGRDLLRGIVAGYEVVSRIGGGAPPDIVSRGFRPVPIMAPFGAAAATAAVRGASVEQMSAAIALAANLSAGFGQGILEGTMEPYLHAGFGARNGMLAADLAFSGVQVADHVLDGPFGFFRAFAGVQPDREAMLGPRDSLGVNRVGSKRFAACLQNQQTMELAFDLVAEECALDDVVGLTLLRPRQGTNGTNSPGVDAVPPYDSMLQAQMAARFTAAAALLRRPVDEASYFASAVQDTEAMALAGRIALEESADDSVSLELRLADGSTRVYRSDSAAGLFPSPDTIRARFAVRAERALGERAAALTALIDDLEAQPDLDALSALLAPAS